MNFSLEFGFADAYVAEDDLHLFHELLDKDKISYSEDFNFARYSEDPFYEVRESDLAHLEESYVRHVEVGWSWWVKVQILASDILGYEVTPHIANVHAWYSVAVPGELEPIQIGTPAPSFRSQMLNQVLQRFRLKMRPIGAPPVGSAILGDLHVRKGELHVVSAPRLLGELEMMIKECGLTGADALDFYRNVDDMDETSTAHAMILIAHRFIQEGIARKHLVWFCK